MERPETLKLVRNIGKTYQNTGKANGFLRYSSISGDKNQNQEIKLNLIKNICIAKETLTRVKRASIKEENLCQSLIPTGVYIWNI
jgi:hypothetical protein